MSCGGKNRRLPSERARVECNWGNGNVTELLLLPLLPQCELDISARLRVCSVAG